MGHGASVTPRIQRQLRVRLQQSLLEGPDARERLLERLRATLGGRELADSMDAGTALSSAAAISLAEGLAGRASA